MIQICNTFYDLTEIKGYTIPVTTEIVVGTRMNNFTKLSEQIKEEKHWFNIYSRQVGKESVNFESLEAAYKCWNLLHHAKLKQMGREVMFEALEMVSEEA